MTKNEGSVTASVYKHAEHPSQCIAYSRSILARRTPKLRPVMTLQVDIIFALFGRRLDVHQLKIILIF